MSEHDDRPARFVLGYEDDAKYTRLVAQHGGDVDAVDLADIQESEDAGDSHIGAISKARARARRHHVTVSIYERRGLIRLESPYAWDWEEERILETVNPDGTRDVIERPERARQ